MYEHFFNLAAEPFRLSPDHRFCYSHAQYAKAKAYMAYAFMRAEGFVMVTGQPGTGKTTLIGDLVETLADEDVVVANLVSTQLAADDLLRMVAFAFGLTFEATEKSSVLQQLNNCFLSLHRAGGRALLIVDEAQDLNHEAMEELRLLTNLQLDGKPLLQIFLLGQPELRELIHDPALEQVHQRIIATSNLRALREDETRAYVEHRLQVVGWQNDPAISAGVFPIIHLFSEGVPRRINLICSRLFLHAFVERRHHIGVEDARTVIEELQEEQLSKRNLLNSELFYAQDSYESPSPGAEPDALASNGVNDELVNEELAEEGALAAVPDTDTVDTDSETDIDAGADTDADTDSARGTAMRQVSVAEDQPDIPAGPAHSIAGVAGRGPVSMLAWAALFSALAAALLLRLIGFDNIV